MRVKRQTLPLMSTTQHGMNFKKLKNLIISMSKNGLLCEKNTMPPKRSLKNSYYKL